MAYENYFPSSHTPTLDYLDWGLHSLEAAFLNDPMPHLVKPTPVSSDFSTGYLEDAVSEWVDRCKRRWTLEDQTPEDVKELCHGFWSSNYHGDFFDTDLNCFTKDTIIIPDEPSNPSSNSKATSTVEDQAVIESQLISSSSSSYKDLNRKDYSSKPREFSQSPDQHSNLRQLSIKEKESGGLKKKKKKVIMRVAYPFAVVKPGGIEGGVTLDEINERMLMRPMRPVRHPVGEFACVPCVSGAGRPGLSGKAVVGLTKIHTQGRGTITIIRTRG